MARNTETKLKLDVPPEFDASQRAEVAEKVMEFIIDRSKHGYNVNGRDWSGKAGEYTDAYAKRKGVSAGGPVDLSLSHDMLDGMRYFPTLSPTGQITVGYKKGTKLERKAEGNIQGTYGQDAPIPGKARPFLDILQKDLKEIIDEVRDGD
jgi:phage gpG-like protein